MTSSGSSGRVTFTHLYVGAILWGGEVRMNKQQPLTLYYAWVVRDSDGREGVISAFVPGLPGITPLQNRDNDVVLSLGGIAKTHADRRGQEVRLVKFVRAQVLSFDRRRPWRKIVGHGERTERCNISFHPTICRSYDRSHRRVSVVTPEPESPKAFGNTSSST